MPTDAFFMMGHQHLVCQDYATAGPDFVALADGCSSSPHTDFGARLLCRMAGQHPVTEVIHAAAPLLRPLGLPETSLDATLLFARHRDDAVEVYGAGDGVVVARRRDGRHTTHVVSYPSGAPRYLSYDLCPTRSARYDQEFGRIQLHTIDGAAPLPVDAGPQRWSWPVAEYDLILVLSDGALSFRRPTATGTEPVPVAEIVSAMLAIKTFSGAFLARRARRFLLEASAQGWVHDDDFAVAAIYVGEVV